MTTIIILAGLALVLLGPAISAVNRAQRYWIYRLRDFAELEVEFFEPIPAEIPSTDLANAYQSGRIVSVTRPAAQQLGYEPHELEGTTIGSHGVLMDMLNEALSGEFVADLREPTVIKFSESRVAFSLSWVRQGGMRTGVVAQFR